MNVMELFAGIGSSILASQHRCFPCNYSFFRQAVRFRDRQSNHSFPNCHVNDGVEASLAYRETWFVLPLSPSFPLMHDKSKPVKVNVSLDWFIIFIVSGTEDFLFYKPFFQMTYPE